MQKITLFLGLFFMACFSLMAQSVKFTGSPSSLISTTATLAEGKKVFYTSGLTASAQKPDLADSDYDKFGDTYLQAKNILDRFDALLKEAGLKRSDVFSMRVFIAPDTKTGKYDFDGWNKAYKEYYGTTENPNKPVRATYGIATLVSPTKFIEIEIIAAYP
jgi:enamine deaminase RidA (YjgF/YER057c/UK114 family)